MAKGKGKPKKDDKKAAVPEADRKKSEKEIQLSEQLAELNQQNSNLKEKLNELRLQNRHLEETANQSIGEQADYSMYMRDVRDRRSKDVIRVNDRNKQDIFKIGQECEELEKRFAKTFEDLNLDLEEKKKQLVEAEEELSSLDYIKGS